MRHATELVWDCDESATATSGAFLLSAGLGTDWTPVALLITAAGVSLLNTFMEHARNAGVPILGYVAQQTADVDSRGDVVGISVTASISVPTNHSAAQAQGIWTLSVHDAPILRALECPVACEPCIVVLGPPASAQAREA